MTSITILTVGFLNVSIYCRIKLMISLTFIKFTCILYIEFLLTEINFKLLLMNEEFPSGIVRSFGRSLSGPRVFDFGRTVIVSPPRPSNLNVTFIIYHVILNRKIQHFEIRGFNFKMTSTRLKTTCLNFSKRISICSRTSYKTNQSVKSNEIVNFSD